MPYMAHCRPQYWTLCHSSCLSWLRVDRSMEYCDIPYAPTPLLKPCAISSDTGLSLPRFSQPVLPAREQYQHCLQYEYVLPPSMCMTVWHIEWNPIYKLIWLWNSICFSFPSDLYLFYLPSCVDFCRTEPCGIPNFLLLVLARIALQNFMPRCWSLVWG